MYNFSVTMFCQKLHYFDVILTILYDMDYYIWNAAGVELKVEAAYDYLAN